MGEVWLARDLELDRPVALKLYPCSYEANILANLTHGNIVTIYQVGRDGDTSWLAMQYVDGKELSGTTDLSPRRVATIIRDVARGVDHAHRLGIVHRDLKPPNILITKDDHPYILDFGLAYSPSKAVLPGEIVGTFNYMSPQQATGAPANPLDDIYSLGITMGELLKGFIPRRLFPIILKCTEFAPEDRYQSAADLAGALDGYLNRVSWKRVALAVMGVLLVVFLATGGTSWFFEARISAEEQAVNWCRVGEQKLMEQDDAGAIVAFTNALHFSPKYRTYLFRSFAYWRRCDYDASVEDLESAIKMDPLNPAARRTLKDVLDSRAYGATHPSHD